MKRLFSVIISLLVCLSFYSCSDKNKQITDDITETTGIEITEPIEVIDDKESEKIDKIYNQLSSYEKDNLVFTNYPDFAIVLVTDASFPIIQFKDNSKKEFEIEFKIINMTDTKRKIDKMCISTYFMEPDDNYDYNPVSTDTVDNLKMNKNVEKFDKLTFDPYEIKQVKYTLSCDQSFNSFVKAFYLPIYYSMSIRYKPQGKDYEYLSDDKGNVDLTTHTVVDFLYL